MASIIWNCFTEYYEGIKLFNQGSTKHLQCLQQKLTAKVEYETI